MTKKIDEKIMDTVRKMDAYLSVSKEINNKMSTESVREFLQMVLSIISNTKDDFDTLSEARMKEIEDALSYIVEEYKTMCADMDGKTKEATKKMQGILKSADFLLEQVKADRENLLEDVEMKIDKVVAQAKVDHNGLMQKVEEYKGMIPSTYILQATEVRDSLQSLSGDERLDISAIKGIDDLEKRLMSKFSAMKGKPVSAGYRGGNYGIKSIKQGSNITITYNGDPANGDITISATGSGGGGSVSIGDSIGSATIGSVFYAGTAGVLAQDNSNFFYDETNHRLIIGATATDNTAIAQSMNVVKTGLAFYTAMGYGVAGSSGGFYTGYASGGTPGSATAVPTGSTLVGLSGRGYDGTAWTTGSQASILLQTAENWSNTARGTAIVFNTTPIGSTTNTAGMILSSAQNLAIGIGSAQLTRLGVAVTRSSANTSNVGINFQIYSGTFTDTSSSGTVAQIYGASIAATTLVASSSTTYTDGATVYISGAPIASTNVTITNNYALIVDSGTVRLDGNLTFAPSDSSNIVFGTSTGTKIGTATSQKLAFYNSTPIVQPTGDVITALQNLGLVASATITASTITSGAALTKADDTNVTLTLGGTPASALLVSASLTLGWTGTLAVARGGTGTGSAGITAFNNITGYTASGATGTTSTNLVFSTSPSITTPTFVTSATVPLIIGGSGTTGTQLTFQTTTGNGTTDQMLFKGGNNGASTFATLKLNSLDLGTSAVFSTGTIELGHASDTTIARSSAGVVTIEGVVIDTISATNTLTNKTLTSPKIGTQILDTNGNELFILTATASAVNEITFANAATGTDPTFTASGGDSNVGIKFVTKGTGYVKGVLKRFAVRLVDSATDTATGTSIGGDFRLSRNPITIINVGAYVDTAGTTGLMTIDINEGGTTIMSTNKITLDSTEKTSETAATAPGVTDTAIAADAIITIDVDGVQTTKAKGLTVWIDYVEA